MKAVVIESIDNVSIKEVSYPEITDDDVVIIVCEIRKICAKMRML